MGKRLFQFRLAVNRKPFASEAKVEELMSWFPLRSSGSVSGHFLLLIQKTLLDSAR
jgi:hypothetical protein